MTKKAWALSILAALILVGLGVFAVMWVESGPAEGPRGASSGAAPQEVKWTDLEQLNYRTGEAPAWLRALSGQAVRVPGFVVPLENNPKIREFLLVPNQAYCNHVPPPPPNLMIMVRMDKTIDTMSHAGPVWLEGILSIETQKSRFGESSYLITGSSLKPYQ